MKIAHYIFLGFVFILLLFAITTYINFSLSEAVTENEDYYSRSTNIIRNSGRFQRNILIMVNGLRGYLLTAEKSFIETYNEANNENDSILKELTSQLTDSSQSQVLREIKQLNDKWEEEYTEPLREAKMQSNVSRGNLDTFNKFYKEKFATGNEKNIQQKLLQKFKQFANYEYEIREKRKEKLSASVYQTRNLSFILIAISVLSASLVIAFLVIKISKRIKQLTNMANAIAAGNYNVNIAETGNDELSSLVKSLNHMAGELSKNISLLQNSNGELAQFAHIVSHDMKGPLRGISNVVSWIEEDHANELTVKLSEYLAIIKGRIIRAENLIEGLLSYARADKEEIEKEWVDIKVLINEVLENIPDNGNVNVEISGMPFVNTERLLLFQVFSNIIGNAIKYNDKAQGKVKIYYKEDATQYEFFVEDNGIGIAENYHRRIFLIFQTLQERDSFESTGVGLAIVKKILDSRKEQINVISEPGNGSVFSFTWKKFKQ